MKKTSRKTRSKGLRPLTPLERSVCEAFAARLMKYNAVLEQLDVRRISFGDLARLTGRHRDMWGYYARGDRPMPLEAMLDIAAFFRERPQDIFPADAWRWALLTQKAPDERLDVAEQLLSELREPERADLMRIMDMYARSNRRLQRQIMRAARRLTEAEREPAAKLKSAGAA